MSLRDRPTADLVVLSLVLLIAVVVVGALVGAILLAIFRPAIDLTKIAIRLADVTNTLIGAVVGYLAGRSATRGDREDR